MRELNYRPNYNAQNLKKGKTKLIGVLLPELESPYQDIYFGMCKIFEGKQYYPILKLTGNDYLLEQDMLQSYLDMGVSGIIAVPARPQASSVYKEIEKKKIPLVVVERRLEGIDCNYVVFDNATLIRHQVQEFQENGNRRRYFCCTERDITLQTRTSGAVFAVRAGHGGKYYCSQQ